MAADRSSLPRPEPKPRSPRTTATGDVATLAHGDGILGVASEGAGLYRLLVDSVTDYAIFALDTKGTILSWNAGAARIKGYAPTEIIGKDISTFYLAEDVRLGKPQQLLAAAAADGHVEDLGWRVRKDGTRFWASVVITALHDPQDALVGFAKVTRDLTERREAEESLRRSEERFRLMVQSVRDYGIFMLDPQGIIVSWNDGAQRLNGYAAAEIVGQHFSRFYPVEDNKAGKPAMELREAGRVGRYEDEGWRVRKDGSVFWASVVITAIRNADNNLLGFAKVTRDLTERRAAEARAIDDAKRIASIESANRTKSEFLAAMSHELRTPLNAIGGYSELLEIGVAGETTEKQRTYLDRIRAAQQHLLTLINDLLNYSKIEAGQVRYDLAPVPIDQVVSKAAVFVEPQARRKGIGIDHPKCDPSPVALADRVKVEQIVLNLLSNAVKFTPVDGSIAMRCGLDGDRAFFEVSDTGPGIPSEQREAVFEPFVQLGRSLTSIQEGTGLGLAISRDLARAMGGDITVSERPGGGSVFRLELDKV